MKLGKSAALALLAILTFHAAQVSPPFGGVFALFICLLIRASSQAGARCSFYLGLVVGFGIYAPQLGFFYTLFGPAAVLLWSILALYTGLFAFAAERLSGRGRLGLLLLPFVWTGLEYFRSELNYLRFTWLSAGYTVDPTLAGLLGVYGTGFVMAGLGVAASAARPRYAGIVLLIAACSGPLTSSLPQRERNGTTLMVSGVQAEFPEPETIPRLLDSAWKQSPGADLFVLSEYSLQTPPTEAILDWCKLRRRHLVIGGREPLPGNTFQNTAYVINPAGQIVHKQGKSVPIQFFADGVPADSRTVWESPWGPIGICICYDLSYTSVTDDLIRQGAHALIVPMMDLQDWGERQHRLHARIGPARAAEYGVPMVRLASSGISQIITADGKVIESGSFPGQAEVVSGEIKLKGAGQIPWDRPLAHVATAIAAATLIYCFLGSTKLPRIGPSSPRESVEALAHQRSFAGKNSAIRSS